MYRTATMTCRAAFIAFVFFFLDDRQAPAQKPVSPAAVEFLATFDAQSLEGVRASIGEEEVGIQVTEGTVVPVRNPERIENLSPMLNYHFEVAKVGNELEVEDVTLQPLKTWKSYRAELPADRYGALHESFLQLDEAVKKSLQSGAMGSGASDLSVTLQNTQDEVVAVYSSIRTNEVDQPLVAWLCKNYDELRESQERQEKARYGDLDNYWPEVYLRIHQNSRAAVAVAIKGRAKPEGSGVLIGSNLVLTCDHVINDRDPSSLELWFDYEQTADGHKQRDSYAVEQVVYRGKTNELSGEPLDFALLLVATADDQPALSETYGRPVISTVHPQREDPIYVVGHPKGQVKTVHDNAFVLFPFRATEDQMMKLELAICAETQESPNRAAELQEFLDSYREVSLDGKTFLLNYSAKWGKAGPVIAAECDTYHGNSGSAAYDRQSHQIIGLLYKGEKDLPVSYEAGWRKHEAILPITEICVQLDEDLPSWRTDYGVQVQ